MLSFLAYLSVPFFMKPVFSCESMNGLPGPGLTPGYGDIETTVQTGFFAGNLPTIWAELDNSVTGGDITAANPITRVSALFTENNYLLSPGPKMAYL